MKPVHKRHQLKEDALVTGTFRFWSYAQEHSEKIIYGIGAVILIIAIIFGVTKFMQAREQRSLNALAQANILYEAEKYEEAIVQFDNLAKNFGGTKASKEAQYNKANALFELERYDEALEAFKKSSKGGDNIIKPSSMKGIADCYMEQGNFAEAAETYLEVAEKYTEPWISLPCLMKAALCYKKLDNLEKAKETYQKVVDNYEESGFVEDAKAEIYILGKK